MGVERQPDKESIGSTGDLVGGGFVGGVTGAAAAATICGEGFLAGGSSAGSGGAFSGAGVARFGEAFC
eukprot:7289787-Alexandrium_andersonii.AAC.1